MKRLTAFKTAFFTGSPLILLLFIAFFINSCRKDQHKDGLNTDISASEITELQQIYKSGITVNANLVLSSTGGQAVPSLIRNLNVKWDKYVLHNSADSSRIVEFDMQADTGLFLTRKLSEGDTLAFRNKTCAVFIKFITGKRLNFFMKVIEDFSKSHKTTIDDLHYEQIPATFSGQVLYYGLDKQFINGYRYTNGKISGTVIAMNVSASTLQLNSMDGSKKTNTLAAEPCGWMDVYQTYCEWGGTSSNPYQYFHGCSETYLYSEYVDCGGSSGGGGGGGGGSGSPAPAPPPPGCPTLALDAQGKIKVLVTQGGGGDGGDGGGGGGVTTPANPCPPVSPQSITNNVKDPCLHSQVDAVINAGVKNEVSALLNHLFSSSTQPVLRFEDGPLSGNLVANTNANHHAILYNGGTLMDATITLNNSMLSSASKEYIAATILHEVIHAYLDLTNRGNGALSHEDMARNYFNTMKSNLMDMFPGLSEQDANGLTWGGLEDTLGYSSQIIGDDLKAAYTAINSNYRHGYAGQPCNTK